MAKLKYDRPINIDSGSDRNITIPNDEVWKVTTREGDVPASPKLYGGGYTFSYGTVSGIAFKHIDE